MTISAARALAAFATALRPEDIPQRTRDLARDCLIDAVACAVYGRDFAWSRMVLAEAMMTGAGGPCRLPGVPEVRLHLPQAALAAGTFAHSFELDSLRKPGAGVHPGATVALPALLAAQAEGASGEALITAIVAGCEVLFRIGAATLHTPEKAGFHAPGLTGPFGAATACGRLSRLDTDALCHAYGLAGSLAGGLLAFARSGQGGMVKRLHLGRAAEGGVLAARLAARGFEGPERVLEGAFGLLDAFCSQSDPTALVRGLGEDWQIETLCLKSYACHVTAQAAIHALRATMKAEGFGGADIDRIDARVADKVMSHHADAAPNDVMGVQYSVPCSLALAAFRDPADPNSFAGFSLDGPEGCLARRVHLAPRGDPAASGWAAEITARLHDGRNFDVSAESFPGCPETPMSAQALRAKFMALTRSLGPEAQRVLYERLGQVDSMPDVGEIFEGL